MRSLSRLIPALAAAAIALAVACGGDSTGPSAASVTGIAGDSQVALTGTPLEFPLSFVVLGSGGQPLQGVTVNWTVTPTGGATFSPTSAQTNAQGTAQTNVTLGSFVGDVEIRGNVPGIQPVVFHALALDPCTYFAPYTLGQSVNGTLATTDCLRFGAYYYDFYELVLPPGQPSVRITQTSSAFDSYVDLYRVVGTVANFVAFDDDERLGVIFNSQLDIILPGDTYVIGSNSFDARATGPYTMTAVTRPATMNGCRAVWVLRGVTVTDTITTADCPDTAAGTDYHDVARMILSAGTVLTISERSTALNPKLTLFQVDDSQFGPDGDYLRTEVATNDDSTPGNLTSFIAYSVPVTSIYDVFIGTSAAGETGAYTFDVSASTTLSPPAPAPPAPVARGRDLWRWRGLEAPPFRSRVPKRAPPLPGAARSH
ncbi:MAG: hypothetical protein WD773_04130 [Gemmatimonadales bacterium]